MTSRPSLDSTPPPEPFKQWEDDILNERENVDVVLDTAYRAGFNAGADQELEACCEWMGCYSAAEVDARDLRLARRPKPPSLKEQALYALDEALSSDCIHLKGVGDTIRRALESLPS